MLTESLCGGGVIQIPFCDDCSKGCQQQFTPTRCFQPSSNTDCELNTRDKRLYNYLHMFLINKSQGNTYLVLNNGSKTSQICVYMYTTLVYILVQKQRRPQSITSKRIPGISTLCSTEPQKKIFAYRMCSYNLSPTYVCNCNESNDVININQFIRLDYCSIVFDLFSFFNQNSAATIFAGVIY